MELTVTYKQVHLYLTITGRIAIQSDVDIYYDINKTPLEIRSDGELGSGDQVNVIVRLYTSQRYRAEGVRFKLTSPPKYQIYDWQGLEKIPNRPS